MKKLAILLFILIILGGAAVYMLREHPELQKALPTSYVTQEDTDEPVPDREGTGALAVGFSQKKSFYNEDIDIELTCGDENAQIYYTTDGNDPDISAKLYSSPIHLGAKNRETCTTIKAIAVSGDDKSEVAVKSYIVGRGIYDRFDEDMLVFVLSADEYDLYDYYNGIAVEGYLRDEYMKNEYKGGEINPTAPANYNIRGRESERPMYVEVFDGNGEQLLSQASGARVVGGYSRSVDQKSWRLFARSMYGEGKFKYPFFTENTDGIGRFITRYDRITLRNGANDREFAGVRDELTMTLAEDAGFPDTQAVRPAAVYLNGEYYGFSWLHEAYSDDYLEMMYGGSKENYRIVGSKELEPEAGDDEDENETQAAADWLHVVELAEKDLTVDLYFNEFCGLVDIDNLMMYYAMQIYIDNKDWPGNNFKVWKYVPSEGELTDSGYLDGKWRFLLFDAEFAWGLYGAGYKDDTLRAVLTGKHMQGASHILNGLLVRDDMREKFADTVCELASGAFSPEHIKERLEMLLEISDKEQFYALKNGYTSDWANEWTFADSRQQIRDFADNRFAVMNRSMMNRFGYSGEKYAVSVTAPGGSAVKLGCMEVPGGENADVMYYTDCKAYLSAEPYEGYEFDRWEVNGIEYRERELAVDRSMADANMRVTVSLFVKKTAGSGKVYVSELYTSGSGDTIEITNTGDSTVNLRGWHLSDKADKPDRWTFPDMEIPAGGTAVIVTKNNNDTSALMHHQTNFSLKTGETLYFSGSDMTIMSEVPVLDLKENQKLVYGADGRYHIV